MNIQIIKANRDNILSVIIKY